MVPPPEDFDVSDVSTAEAIDPKSTATYRSLKAVVIILGVLLLLAFVLVVVGIGMRMSGHAPGQSNNGSQFELPAGAQIQSTQVAGSNLVMTVKAPAGTSVYIFSANDGHLIGRIVPKSP
jgi:hypothetical protein